MRLASLMTAMVGSPTRHSGAACRRRLTREKFSHDNTPLRMRQASSSESVMNRMLFAEL